MRYLGLIFKNSVRNRRRSLLTIASIAVSLCILGLLIAMYQAMFFGEATPAQALRLVTRHRVSMTQPVPIYYRDKIRQLPGVRDLMTWQWFGGTYKDARDPNNMFARFATDPDHFFNVYNEIQMPEDQKQAFLHERTGCIVEKSLADKMHFKLGDRITLVGDIFPVTLELKVVGIYEDPEKIGIAVLQPRISAGSAGFLQRRARHGGRFSDPGRHPRRCPAPGRRHRRHVHSFPISHASESEKAFELSFLSFLGNLRMFLMAICGAVTFTILLVSANTISMSVRERVREVGILKTLGFTPGAILGIVLGEAAMICLAGGAIGCLLAAAMCAGVSHSPGSDMMPALHNLAVTPPVALICLGGALLIGLVSSFVPAWSASRTSILDALRSTA